MCHLALREHGICSRTSLNLQQELDISAQVAGLSGLQGTARKAAATRLKKLLADNNALKMEPTAMALGLFLNPNLHLINCSVTLRDAGASDATDDTVLSYHSIWQQKFMTLMKQAADQAIGARKEAATIRWVLYAAIYLPIAGAAKAAAPLAFHHIMG